MAEPKRAPKTEKKPAPTAEKESAAAPDQASTLEAALQEQTQVMREMLQKLKEIRRRLPAPKPADPSKASAKPKDKAKPKPARVTANSKKK